MKCARSLNHKLFICKPKGTYIYGRVYKTMQYTTDLILLPCKMAFVLQGIYNTGEDNKDH